MHVRIGMNMLLWGMHITPKHIPVFELIAAAGYDGVEIPLADQSPAMLKTMAQACDDLGLARTAVAFVGPETNPIAPQRTIRLAAVDSLKKAIDHSALLNAEFLGGGIYQAHKYFTGCAATAQEWDWCVDYLQICGAYAQQAGIQLGLECLNRFEVFLINTSAQCQRMVEQVGLSNVGVHYDTHHANIEEPCPHDALHHIADVINHVHLSESHRGTLGSGQVDWQANFSALKNIDYSGWLVVEAFGTADAALAAAANIWRNAFVSEEQVLREGIDFIRQHL